MNNKNESNKLEITEAEIIEKTDKFIKKNEAKIIKMTLYTVFFISFLFVVIVLITGFVKWGNVMNAESILVTYLERIRYVSIILSASLIAIALYFKKN